MALGPDPLKVEPDVPTPADVPDVPLVPEPLIEEPEPDPLRSADDPDVPLAPEPPANELEPEVPRPADVPDVPLVPEPLIEEPEPDPLRPAEDPDVPLAPEPPVNELEPEVPRPADEPDVPLIEEPPPRLPVVLEDWSVQSRVEEPEEALGELLPWARATQVVPAKRPAAKPNRVSCCLIDFSTLSAPNRRSMRGAAGNSGPSRTNLRDAGESERREPFGVAVRQRRFVGPYRRSLVLRPYGTWQGHFASIILSA
jgi:hypothetical protein